MSHRPPIKTLFVITSMPVGGAETLLVNLVRRVDRSRIEPEIVCLKDPGPLGERIAAEIPVHSHLIRGKYDLLVLRRLSKLFRERGADAVITVGAGDKMFWGRLAAKAAGVPVILSALHSTGWPDGVGWLNRRLTPITDGFIAVARQHGDFMVRELRFPRDKVFVIPNGIDTARFQFCPRRRAELRQSLGIPETAPVAGIVAALRSEKNHLRWLEIAARVSQSLPDLHLVIAGDGPLRPAIEQRASELGLSSRLRMTGTTDDIPGVLSILDLFALSSDNEANPVSILEALSCSRPVVAPRVGSINESVREGETGYLHDRDDTATAATRWLTLLRDPALSLRLGQTGRELVVTQASVDSMSEGYTRLIEQLHLAKHPAALPAKMAGACCNTPG